jgi:hypothetical protein
MSDYVFHTSCVNSTSEAITDMVDIAEDLTERQFLIMAAKHGFKGDVLSNLGYTAWSQSCDRTAGALFEDDWGISCHRSYYLGVPCLYVCHSGIEYIWISQELTPEDSSSKARENVIDELEDRFDDFVNFCKQTFGSVAGYGEKKLVKNFVEVNAAQLLEWRINPMSFMSGLNHLSERYAKRWYAEQFPH